VNRRVTFTPLYAPPPAVVMISLLFNFISVGRVSNKN